MLGLSVALLVAGAVLLCAEVFMPGFGVCGVTGAALVAASSVITVVTLPLGPFIVLGELAVLAAVVCALFTYLKSKQLYGKIILDETLAEDPRPIGDPEFFLGKEGFTRGPLRPSGDAVFGGASIEVVSDGSYIPENSRVRVTSVDNGKITVSLSDGQRQQ